MIDVPPEREGAFAKLRRRKVVQWSLAYAAGAWALLQGIGFLADAFHWPDATTQVATLLFLLGLPVTAVIAWHHGDRGQQRVTRMELGLLAVLVLCGGGLVWWWLRVAVPPAEETREATPAVAAVAPAADDRSIAVLPFVNMSSDPEQEYFSDGLSEELLNMLAKVPELRVIGRTSSFQYKGQNLDLRLIGERLGVANVLEGSVRRAGDEVRITAQLIRAADGSHLWSETYDRKLEDIFAVQEEIAAQVAGALKIVLAVDAAGGVARAATGNLSAYDLYLEGRYLFHTRTTENVGRAIERLQAATERDPDFAEAHAALAVAVMVARDYFPARRTGVIPVTQAEQAALRALELNPTLGDALAALGMVHASRLEWRDADSRFRDALAAEPHNGMVNMWYGNLLRTLGRMRDAVPLYETAHRFDPQSAIAVGNLALAYVATGRDAEAARLIAVAEERGMRNPTFCIARIGIGTHQADAALVQDALADWIAFFPDWLPEGAEKVLAQAAFDPALRPAARQLLQAAMREERQLATWGTLLVAALAHDYDTAFAAADAGLPATGGSWGVALWHPSLAQWRRDPRFGRLVERLQMPAYWRETGWPDACGPAADEAFTCRH